MSGGSPLDLSTGMTLGLLLTVAALVGSPVIFYVRAMARIEIESKAFRQRFNEHAVKLETEFAGVRHELSQLRKDLTTTLMDTAKQAAIIERVERTVDGLDRRLYSLEREKYGVAESGRRGAPGAGES